MPIRTLPTGACQEIHFRRNRRAKTRHRSRQHDAAASSAVPLNSVVLTARQEDTLRLAPVLQRLIDVLDDRLEDREAAGEAAWSMFLNDHFPVWISELMDIASALDEIDALLSDAPDVFRLGYRDLARRQLSSGAEQRRTEQ